MYCQGQLFCFDAFPSARGQTRRVWRVRQGSSLTWLSIRIRLQGRKPGESNKLFDLYYLHRTLSVLSLKSVVKIRNHPLVYCSPGRIYSGLFCRLSYYCYLTAKLDYYKSHHQYQQVLRYLEGTTMSNRGHRPRIRALSPSLCLEGSTPEDRLLAGLR